MVEEEWRLEGQYHRVDGPAWRQWEIVNEAAVLVLEVWYLEGKVHRVDGPAEQEWQAVDGPPVLTVEEWCLLDKYHRVGKPAIQEWQFVDGLRVLVREDWSIEGMLHRVDGPALRSWQVIDDGHEDEDVWVPLPEPILIKEEWYLHGVQVDPADLHRAAVIMRQWFLRQRENREVAIAYLLRRSGIQVFPGLMGLLRQ